MSRGSTNSMNNSQIDAEPFFPKKNTGDVKNQSATKKDESYNEIEIDEVDVVIEEEVGLPLIEPQDGEFSSFPEIHKKTVEVLKAKGYVNLFPIQQHCFYPVYQREDLLARDLTGSGKTFAFGLPTVEYLRRHRLLGSRMVQAIVLAPTRELALQVTNEL